MRISEILKLLAQDQKLSYILKNNHIESKKNEIIHRLTTLGNSLSGDDDFSNLNEETDELDLFGEQSLPNVVPDELFVYSDGAVSGNPGIGGIGCVVLDKSGIEIAACNENIGIATNNIAEYKAILLAVDVLQRMNFKDKKINFFADSELMVKQIKGEYKIANLELKKLCMEFFEKIKNFEKYDIKHVPREKNKLADNLAVLAKSNKIVNRRIK